MVQFFSHSGGSGFFRRSINLILIQEFLKFSLVLVARMAFPKIKTLNLPGEVGMLTFAPRKKLNEIRRRNTTSKNICYHLAP
jgi:hypothetical protein